MNMEVICETGPPAYRLYPRRLESLTICGCKYKGSTFSGLETITIGKQISRHQDLSDL